MLASVPISSLIWRQLADHLLLVRGSKVVHLMHDGRLTPDAPTDGVRLADDGLGYEVGVTPPLSVN